MPGTPYNAHSLPTPPHSTTKYATIGFCFSHFIVFCVCNAVICYDRTTVSDASSLHEALWYTEEVYKHILELFFNLVYFAQTFDTSIDIGFALPSITWNLTLAMELWSPDFPDLSQYAQLPPVELLRASAVFSSFNLCLSICKPLVS